MVRERLAHFEVTAKLGEGGMGAVYRATDTKLGREVAIKVLPEAVTEDRDRLARFEREARLLAALNHPSIASIYEVGSDNGVHFIVMELAPGESLANRLERGALPRDEAIAIALKIAAALEAAHEQGIIHRDLKPANVQVSEDGDVKVLDFGLAKAFEQEAQPGAELSNSPTLSRHATQAGVLMGTAAYMSPEQARGKAADRRSDIWAFGVVVWEMLAGKRLFSGDTISDTLAAVLRQDIDLDAAPRALHRLLRRCLERSPTQRLQHIGDARLELEDVRADPEPAAERTTSPWPKVAAIAAAAALGALVTFLVVPTHDTAIEPRVSFLQTEPLVTSFPPVISPDGRKVVYSTGDRMWLWKLDQLEPRSWEGEFRFPFFSPDSRHVAYESNGELWRMNLETDERRLICRSGFMLGGVWTEDGTITFQSGLRQGLYRVPQEGGDVLQLAGAFDVSRNLVVALPRGRGLLFTNFIGGVDVYADGEWQSLLEGERVVSAWFSPNGHLFYHRAEDGLWAVPFALETLSPTAGPLHIDAIGAYPSFSSDGRLSYKRGLDRNQFVMRDREGRVTEKIGRPQFNLQDPSVSPDGTVVAGISFEQGSVSVWLHEVVSPRARRLTFDVEAAPMPPSWSPDGRYLYFNTSDDEIRQLDVRGEESMLTLAKNARRPHASADGRYVFYEDLDQESAIVYFNLEDASVQTFLDGAETMAAPRISPDGSLVAYVSDESGLTELYVRRFPSGDGLQQISTGGATTPRWSPDGGELFYRHGQDLMAVPVSTDDRLDFGEAKTLFTMSSPQIYEYAVTADGRFIVADPAEETSTIAIVDEWQSFFEAANE